VCWDIKSVFYAIWSPLTFLMGYNDPRKPSDDLLHGELYTVITPWGSGGVYLDLTTALMPVDTFPFHPDFAIVAALSSC